MSADAGTPPPLPTPGLRRSWWLQEALAAEVAAGGAAGDAADAPALSGEVTAEVAIVGGGYTGMWTAYFLTERVPGVRIVLLEQDICGGGPSGRNGGFVHGWWEQLPYLARRYGPEQALEAAQAADEVVAGIGQWCEDHGVDAWYMPGAYLRVNAFPREANDWDRNVAEVERLGGHGQLIPINAADVQQRCSSPAFGEGLLMPSAASVQPARLARGLRRVLIERGVQIHEGTRVERLSGEGPLTLEASGGIVRAEQVVLALNAWAAGWPGFRLRLLAWGSYMVVTEPIPERLAELGWTGPESISDSRFTISYFRTTRDGRIAFGAGVGQAGFDGRIGRTFTHDRGAIERVAANFRHLFPMLADVRLEDAWGGPIDISAERLPEIGSRHGGRMHYAHGFAGNGTGASRLAGRILAALVDGGDDPVARLAFVGRRQQIFPPEPARFVGARLIRRALIRGDDDLDVGRRPAWWVRALARIPKLLGYRFDS
ncbi:MAG: NAD(P)/FAD-dependent oxidoreductase [Candidatus Limnocylindria bacterium]